MSKIAAIKPWWEMMPEGYQHLSDETSASLKRPLMVLGTAAVDHIAASSLGVAVSAAMTPRLITRGLFDAERERLRFYQTYADRADVAHSFVKPPEVSVRVGRPQRNLLTAKGMRHQTLSFESPFTPLNPELRKSYLSYRRNRTAQALYYRHEDGPRPTLIFLHGFSAPWYWFNRLWFQLDWFYRKGYDLLLAHMPFHGARRELHHPFNGYGFVAGGFSHLNEAVFQAVSDTRSWVDFLLREGAPSVGLSGMSLGGYVTAVTATAEERLAFAIPNSPVVSLIDMAREWIPSGAVLNFALWRSDARLTELRHAVAAHSPLTYSPQLAPERSLIIGGGGDRFTSPRFVRQLHKHWRGSALHWFPGNHLLHLHQGEYLRLMLRFMNRHSAGVPQRPVIQTGAI